MATSIQSLTAAPPSADPTSLSANNAVALANENTFLQLLITQIKNQDPTQPMDSSAFLSQLAQFSQLEQLIGIRQELQPQQSTASTTANSGAGSNNSSNTSAS